jgi:hypothetical protein
MRGGGLESCRSVQTQLPFLPQIPVADNFWDAESLGLFSVRYIFFSQKSHTTVLFPLDSNPPHSILLFIYLAISLSPPSQTIFSHSLEWVQLIPWSTTFLYARLSIIFRAGCESEGRIKAITPPLPQPHLPSPHLTSPLTLLGGLHFFSRTLRKASRGTLTKNTA